MQQLSLVIDRKEDQDRKLVTEINTELSSQRGGVSIYFRRILRVLDLDARKKVIFVDRYIKSVERLERSRNRMRCFGGVGNTIVQIGSVLTPALLSVQHIDGSGAVFWTTWGISLLTGISATMLSLFKINKKDAVYSDALRKLVAEGFRYVELADRYKTSNQVDAHDRFFSEFFTHVESILLNETRVNGAEKAMVEKKDEDELKNANKD